MLIGRRWGQFNVQGPRFKEGLLGCVYDLKKLSDGQKEMGFGMLSGC